MIEIEMKTKRLITEESLKDYLDVLVKVANYPEEIKYKLPIDKRYVWSSQDINDSHVSTEITLKETT
jgi:hypothetical protein